MKKILCILTLYSNFLLAQVPVGNGLYELAEPKVGSIYLGNTLRSGFVQDDSMNIWVGFGATKYNPAHGGLGKFSNGSWTVYHTGNSGIISNQITDVIEWDSSKLLIGTREGLNIFNRVTGAWTNFTTANSSLPSNHITSLALSGSIIWIGTNNGLVKWENGNMSVTNGADWGTATDSVTDIATLGQSVYIGTSEGLVTGNSLAWSLHLRQGNTTHIRQVCLDANNTPYVIGDSGLFRFTGGQYEALPTSYACLQHLDEKDIRGGVGLCSSGGKIYFTPGVQPAIGHNADQDLFLYEIDGNEIRELQFFNRRVLYANNFLKTDRDGNMWLLSTKQGYLTMVKPGEYKEWVAPHLNEGKEFQRLDINKMDAGILNRGDMFWNCYDRSAMEVPKGSCTGAAFASSLWIGGLDQGNKLYMAAQTYRQSGTDYMPGPLDTVNFTGDWQDGPYNRIWKINRRDIIELQEAFSNGQLAAGTYTVPTDIWEWPAHGSGNHSRTLAPFVDANGDGVYNLFDGDYPQIKGDQMLYWIFNDNSLIHSETGGSPFGVEVHASAYAFYCDNIADGDSDEVLNYTTFYHYRIINRSDRDYKNVFYGNWFDPDLGNYTDDRVGCHPEGNFMYAYNGDNVDEGAKGYGENPPMINVLWLTDTMRNFIYYHNDYTIAGNPTTADHYYGYMNSTWKDGSVVTYGGNGYQTGAPDRFMFSGSPYDSTQWNETSAGFYPGDRRMLSSVGGEELLSGEEKILEYAVVYTREPNAPNGTNTSWAKNLSDINRIKSWYHGNAFPTCSGIGAFVEPVNQNESRLQVFPNPGTNGFQMVLNGNYVTGDLTMFDITGRVVLTEGNTDGNISTEMLMPGVYFVVLQSGNMKYHAKWVKE